MADVSKFSEEIQNGYTTKGDSIFLGAAVLDGKCIKDAKIKIPLKTLNRHGLIAGATGTGKTKSLQLIAESLSKKGIPSVLMDIKGDLSGIAEPGLNNPKVLERMVQLDVLFDTKGNPVELFSLKGKNGIRLRATVTEFGPILFSRIIDLNDTQSGVMAVIFKYCDDKQLPLLDLQDVKKVLNYLMNEGKDEIQSEYGMVAGTTAGSILRKIVELEQQGANLFFGEPSFEVDDLTRVDENGNGIISIIRLDDIQDKPKLFSTFMLQMLAEIYNSFPEEGDVEQPKLCFFIDEAHLVFSEASDALLNQIETIIKLIRSKGVGVYFVTQNPDDIPESVLGQLGFKIQHALRAFTEKDRKAIKLVAQNYPITEYYNKEQLITELGIGEALVTVLSEKGTPTPLAHTLMAAPGSRMDILNQSEINSLLENSSLKSKYENEIDRESAYDILNKKIEVAGTRPTTSTTTKKTKEEESTIKKVFESPIVKQVGRTVAREITRGLLGVLGLGGKRKGGWF
jgi:uncharacterized protein